MRNLLLTLRSALLLLLLAGTVPNAMADQFVENGIRYETRSDNTVAVISNYESSYQGDITIPKTVSHKVYSGYEEFTLTFIVSSIESYAFSGCTGLTSVSMPNSIKTIGYNAFYGCSALSSIEIPNGVESIDAAAFSGCSDLTSAYIPTSVKTIGSEAFSDCSGLTSITIPNSVTSIGDNVFSGCSSLTELYFNAVSCADFTESPFTNTFIANIQVGDDCQKIPANFTKDLTSLRAITLGNSVTTIGNSAFLGCTSMTNVSMGSALTTINNSAFEGCTGLKEISLPMSLRTIRSKAFYNCSGLQSVYSYADNPPVMESSDIFNCYNTATLYVPYEVLNTYKNTYYWNNFYKILGVDANGNVLIAGISLNSTSKQIYVNQTFKLTATITPSEATNKTVNWTSSNPSVAIVDNDGLVTALSDGTAVITATTTDGTDLSASCYVTVMSIPVTSILLNKTSLTLDINDVNTYQLTATVSPSNATNKTVTWSSSNTAVASVSSDGLVTLIAPGNATITATTTDGTDLSASCQVTVVKRVKSITLSESSMTIYLPETAQLIATITPSDAVNPVLNWTSSNTSVATVNSEGFITSIGVGTTTIKATTTDGSNLSATCQVSVNKRYVTSITLNETSLVMHIGDTFQLATDIQPENASDQTLNWSTGNSSVASVDNNGLVTAIAGGTTYIQAKTRDGSSLTARCTIEVMPDYYITLDTLSHIRGEATRIVDLPVSLVNKNPISGIQFDVSLPNGVEFNLVDSVPDVWLDDARGTRSHSISASQLSNGKYRVLVTSATSRDLRGNDGVLVHMNMLLPQQHDTGNRYINITNIIASEADETRHTLDNKSTVVHFYYIVGDADANAVVDIADHAATASKILGRSPSPFYYDAANVDDNYSLDVADLVGITNIALEIKPITVRQAQRRGETENQLSCDRLNLNAGGEKEINLGIDCGFAFAGFQMDVELPNGLTLTGATLGDDASALGLATEMMPDGKIRILGTSFSDSEVDGNCPRLLTLKVKAERNYMPGSEIKFADILFAERDMTAHAFDGLCIEYIEPSTVYELTDDTRIYVENGNIIVDTPVAGIVQLIAIDGRMIEYQAHVGHNVFAVDASGIYIINFNGKTLKVRL